MLDWPICELSSDSDIFVYRAISSRLILKDLKKNLGGIASSNMFAKHACASSDPLPLRHCPTVACLNKAFMASQINETV